MNKKNIGILMILLVFAALPLIYYYISQSLVILGASEGIVAGSFIGYYAATKHENSS